MAAELKIQVLCLRNKLFKPKRRLISIYGLATLILKKGYRTNQCFLASLVLTLLFFRDENRISCADPKGVVQKDRD